MSRVYVFLGLSEQGLCLLGRYEQGLYLLGLYK